MSNHLVGDKFGGSGGALASVDLTANYDGVKHNHVRLGEKISQLVFENKNAIHGETNASVGFNSARKKAPTIGEHITYRSGSSEYRLVLNHMDSQLFQAGAGLGAGTKPCFAVEIVKNPQGTAPTVIRRWVIPYEGVSPFFDPGAVPAVQTVPA